MTKPKKTKSPKPKNVKGGVVIYELSGDGSDTGIPMLVSFSYSNNKHLHLPSCV